MKWTLNGNISSVGYFQEVNLVSCSEERLLGMKNYEIANYLGNVHAVITDRKKQQPTIDGSLKVSFYHSDIIQSTDYYPFG